MAGKILGPQSTKWTRTAKFSDMFENYVDVRTWLENFIPQTYTKKNLGLNRIKHLLKLLGNPQDNFKSIHIAGTSGKGSTAYYIARLLQSSSVILGNGVTPESSFFVDSGPSQNDKKGFKVGLHISPHLVDIRERMQIFSSPVIPALQLSFPQKRESIQGKLAGIQKATQDWILDPFDNTQDKRVENDSTIMPMKRFVELMNAIKPAVEGMSGSKVGPPNELGGTRPYAGGLPSYFEILVAASFLYFAREKVDWAVVEVGLGGRLDATNVLRPELAVITNIGLDHTEILGKTISKIAREKAGIIKEGIPVVTGGPSTPLRPVRETPFEVTQGKQGKQAQGRSGSSISRYNSRSSTSGKALGVIKKVVKQKKATLITIDTQSEKSDINNYLALYNDILKYSDIFATKDVFFLALAALSQLKIPLSKANVIEAFSASFPARFEEIAPNILVDGAHNLGKMKTLVNFLKMRFPSKKISLVVAFKKGKDWKGMLRYLTKNLDIERVYTTQFYAVTDTGFFAAVDPLEIKRFMINDLGFRNFQVKTFENSQEAVFEALQSTVYREPSTVLITGSLYLAGEARTIWKLPEF